MMKVALAVAAILVMCVSAAHSRTTHRISGENSSACLSHSYGIDAMFKCEHDEFIAPTFSVSPSLCHGEEVGVAILEFNDSAGRGTHLLAKKIAKSCFKGAHQEWADSRKCPQLIAVSNSKDRFVFPRPKLISDREARIMDGSLFTLELDGFYPRDRAAVGVSLSGQDNSPVGRWVTNALKSLEPCWSKRRPPR
jgi:hypothetical protein